jgi:hypothetical protein
MPRRGGTSKDLLNSLTLFLAAFAAAGLPDSPKFCGRQGDPNPFDRAGWMTSFGAR